MPSTLAQQLQLISATSVNTLSAERQKRLYSVSLLYPSQQAATQDLTTVYSIALEGFRELVELNPSFQKYDKSLFAPSSVSFDRFLQTKKVNNELNRTIDNFLSLVGVRLLLKSSLKALEWLVRRFRIHEQNTTTLILTFLPYHNHPVFTRLMSIIPHKSLPIALSFLTPHLNPPTCPPRASITKSLTIHSDFFNLLTTHVLEVLSRKNAHHTLVSFYISVTVETLNMMCTQQTFRKNPQDIIIRIMPTIIQGLKTQQNPEFQIGCYMITTVLVANLPLDDKFLDSLMSGVVDGWGKVTISPGLACVALLAQERQSTTPLPIQVVNGLCCVRGLGQMLVEMGRKYRVDGLATGLAMSILSERQFSLERIELVETIISEVSIPFSRRRDLFMRLLQAATTAELNEVLRVKMAEFLTQISERSQTQEASEILQSLMHSGGFDIETLELKLQTVIRPAALNFQVPATDSPTTPPAPPTDPKKEFEELISCLPDTSIEASFLSPSPPPLLPDLYRALLQATAFPSNTELERLFHLPLFAQGHTNESFTLTFLVKIWTSKTYPVLVRLAALAQANKIISSYPESNTKVDYQALLPYVLIALADQNKKVRSEAVNMAVSLSSCLKHIESIRKKDKSITVEIWGFGSIFGKNTKETGEVKWMETSEARKFLCSVGILDALEEAVVDKDVVYRVLAHSLGKGGNSLKKSLKVTVMSFLASHVLGLTDLSIKLQLLKLVNAVTPGIAAKAKPAVAIVESWVQVDDYVATWVKKCSQDQVEIEEIEKEILCTIGKFDKGEGVGLLISIIKGSYGTQPSQIGDMRKQACIRLREIWSSLPDDVKGTTAQKLLEAATVIKAEDIVVSGEALDVLRNVAVSVDVFENWLQDSLHELKGWTAKLGSGPSDDAPSAKRTKRYDSGSDTIANVIHKLTVVLELMETRSFGEKGVGLLKLGFGVLSEVMNVAGDIGITVSYLLQLTLSILGDIVNSIKTSKYPQRKLEGSVRADILVNCIRSTLSPQIQNRALLLVAALADVAPEVVLHSVMPIFTFMGASVLRQDDEYSAHVIEQTVERVIPPLVKSLHHQFAASSAIGVVGGVAELVLSFVTAYKHIPVHRRLRLFTKLIDTLGAHEFLHVVLAMLAERYYDTNESAGGEREQEIVIFGRDIASAFGEETQLSCVTNYLDIIDEVLHKRAGGVSSLIFSNLQDVAPEDCTVIALKLFRMLASILESQKLQSQIGKRLGDGGIDSERIRSYFSTALEKVLVFGNEYREGIMHGIVSGVMEKLLALLSMPEFVKVIQILIMNSRYRRESVVIFNERVASEFRPDAPSRAAVLGVMSTIASILTSSETPIELKADALSCISTVTTKFGKREPEPIFNLSEAIIGDGALRGADEGLRVMALVCLTDMTTCLGGRILPIVPKTVPLSLEFLKSGGRGSGLVNNAVFAFIEALISTIPSFMASYLQGILKGAWASTITYEAGEAGEGDSGLALMEVTRDLRSELLGTIAKKMDVKAVILAMSTTWGDALRMGSSAINELLTTVKCLLMTASKNQVQKVHPLLATFFLQAFDVRKQVFVQGDEVEIDEDEVDHIEKLCLETGLQMVMKLNDSIFKPMFLTFSDWAAEDFKAGEGKEGRDRDISFQRSITFYNWLGLLTENLKSLITEYHSFILSPSIAILTGVTAATTDSNPSTVTPSSLTILLSALHALTSSFTTDSKGFWTFPVHFNQLQPALLDAISFVPLEPNALTPALSASIVELATACTSSEDQLKAINSSLLKHMRSGDWQVRLAAVKAEMALYERMGEEWLGMLPETVPYIAELLEDDEEVVERETQKLISKVEEFLGEGELAAMLR